VKDEDRLPERIMERAAGGSQFHTPQGEGLMDAKDLN